MRLPRRIWLIAVGVSFVDGRLRPVPVHLFVVGMAASFLLGSLRDAERRGSGLAIVLGGAAIVVYNLPTHSIGQLVFYPAPVRGRAGSPALRCTSGRSRRKRRRRVRRRPSASARSAARIAVAEERARIARELHDVVAHAVSVMVLQAGAVRHKLPDELAEDKDALRHVEQTGRSALAEMRRLLGAMRSDGDGVDLAPQPGMDGLDALLDEVGRAGLPVELHVDGERFPLPRAIDLSAYRIVQEGLTNALKHAHASHADVTLGYAPDELRIEVRDDGRGTSTSDGRGHGLVGVRERVKIYGGEMTASTAPEGGFVLSARLPIEGNGA